jgi:hypothetical protein
MGVPAHSRRRTAVQLKPHSYGFCRGFMLRSGLNPQLDRQLGKSLDKGTRRDAYGYIAHRTYRIVAAISQRQRRISRKKH